MVFTHTLKAIHFLFSLQQERKGADDLHAASPEDLNITFGADDLHAASPEDMNITFVARAKMALSLTNGIKTIHY